MMKLILECWTQHEGSSFHGFDQFESKEDLRQTIESSKAKYDQQREKFRKWKEANPLPEQGNMSTKQYYAKQQEHNRKAPPLPFGIAEVGGLMLHFYDEIGIYTLDEWFEKIHVR